MKTNELPAPAARVSGTTAFGQAVYANTVRRVVERFTYPAEKPVITLLLYYGFLFLVGALVVRYVPGASEMISGERLQELSKSPGLTLDDATSKPWFAWNISLSMLLSMLGAFFLMLPASWVYMATRQKKGFDQQVVQTFIILAVAVAGVIIIAKNSVALAFSLAGVVGAVRFRNNLPETRDTLFVFLAIGVGLAAGVDALTAAAVLSMVFNFVVLAMDKMEYGSCALGNDPRMLLVGAAPADPKKNKDFNRVLLVRTSNADKSRPAVEAVLSAEVRRFHLAEIEANAKGKGVMRYLLRMGKGLEPKILEDAIIERCAPTVLGARVH
jgi:hypothetical protein